MEPKPRGREEWEAQRLLPISPIQDLQVKRAFNVWLGDLWSSLLAFCQSDMSRHVMLLPESSWHWK